REEYERGGNDWMICRCYLYESEILCECTHPDRRLRAIFRIHTDNSGRSSSHCRHVRTIRGPIPIHAAPWPLHFTGNANKRDCTGTAAPTKPDLPVAQLLKPLDTFRRHVRIRACA